MPRKMCSAGREDIYFPNNIDLAKCDDAHWLMHELEHSVQYRTLGGKVPFVVKYAAQVAEKVISTQSFNVHDILEIEADADAKADALRTEICDKIAHKFIKPGNLVTTQTVYKWPPGFVPGPFGGAGQPFRCHLYADPLLNASQKEILSKAFKTFIQRAGNFALWTQAVASATKGNFGYAQVQVEMTALTGADWPPYNDTDQRDVYYYIDSFTEPSLVAARTPLGLHSTRGERPFILEFQGDRRHLRQSAVDR